MAATGTRQALATRYGDLPRGIFWVIVSMALFAGLAVFSRAVMDTGMHPIEVVFFRNLLACLMFTPLLLWRGASLVRSSQLNLYGLRVSMMLVSMWAWFYALSKISIGEVTAIGFLGPLCGTLGAAIFLRETVRARRWIALIVGFLGALVILRPGLSSVGAGQMAALLGAMLSGMGAVMVKQLTAGDDPDKIVFLTNLMLTPMSLVPALFVWQWPQASQAPLLLGMGLCAVLGHAAWARSYALLDASLAQTFEFSRLLFAVAFAYMVFGETMDGWTWVGAVIIFASSAYITRREAQLRRARLPGSAQ